MAYGLYKIFHKRNIILTGLIFIRICTLWKKIHRPLYDESFVTGINEEFMPTVIMLRIPNHHDKCGYKIQSKCRFSTLREHEKLLK